jgi:hypothetical protein
MFKAILYEDRELKQKIALLVWKVLEIMKAGLVPVHNKINRCRCRYSRSKCYGIID